MKRLNLGCGRDIKPKEEGWINLDKFENKGVDVVHNLEILPYPFKDNYFDEIYASGIMEHIGADWIEVMNELKRITKPNGIIKLVVPHFSSSHSYLPTHKKFFNYLFFKDYFKNYNKSNLEILEGFKLKKIRLKFEKNPLLFYNYIMGFIVNKWKFYYHYERTGWHNLFPANYIYVELEVKK